MEGYFFFFCFFLLLRIDIFFFYFSRYLFFKLIFLSGNSWAATTTEGLMIYSLDENILFDPFELTEEITPISVEKAKNDKEYLKALVV